MKIEKLKQLLEDPEYIKKCPPHILEKQKKQFYGSNSNNIESKDGTYKVGDIYQRINDNLAFVITKIKWQKLTSWQGEIEIKVLNY